MLPLGFLLAAAGAVGVLIGLFSDDGRFVGWHIGTHTSLLIGVASTLLIVAGVRLIRWGAVRGVKNVVAQRKAGKRVKGAED